MSVKAVAFDIDGTLYPNRSMYFHSIPFYFTHLRQVMAFSKVRRDIRKVEPVQDFASLQADLLARELSLSTEEAARMVEDVFYGEWERIFRRVRPFPGVGNFLAELRERGIKTGALSDFPVGNKLDYFGLADYWDVIMTSNESGYLKPSKEPFLELARRLGFQPQEILYVGNNPVYDVEGCREAGMMSAYIAPAWKKQHPLADVQFSRYGELREYINDLLAR